MPLIDMVVRRGLLLADAADGSLSNEGRAELEVLLIQAERAGCLHLARPMIKAIDVICQCDAKTSHNDALNNEHLPRYK
jgi:hypothetical protein